MREPAHSANFTRVDVTAAPEHAAQLRREFSDWLKRHFALDPVTASDVVLAVNEALSNAAEFAYLGASRPGVMHLRADYDSGTAVLTVTITDEGTWRATDPDVCNPARGRGIELMQALASRTDIESSSGGTRVRLQWQGIQMRTPPAAAACALGMVEAAPPE